MNPKKGKIYKSSLLQEGTRLMQYCPLCRYEFGKEEILILEQHQSAHLVHLTCPKCSSAMLALVMTTKLGQGSVGMVTDLDANEAEKLYKKQSISEEDLFDFHHYIESRDVVAGFRAL